MPAARHWRRNELFDFTGAAPSPGVMPEARFCVGGVYLWRARLAANEGAKIGAAQLVVLVNESEPFEVEWRATGDGRLRHDWLMPWSAQIAPAGEFLHLHWSAQPTIFAVAFESKLVNKLRSDIGAERAEVRPHFAVRDPEIDALVAKLRLELQFGGASGRIYAESLGVVLAVHLLRNYVGDWTPRAVRGGLGSRRLRRILEYVETHMSEPLTLAALGEIAGLSPHHFAGAFRASTGVSPHRYLLERRIAHAFELLARSEETVTTVAHALGFSSHGHFTTSFRRFVGVTPSQFKAGRR